MKAVDGKPIAERWAITYQLQRQVLRCFRGEPDEVVAAKRVMKLIEELSAAEERERVMREALQNVVDGNDRAHNRKETLQSWPGSDFRRLAKAALATPAPEKPKVKQCAKCKGRGLIHTSNGSRICPAQKGGTTMTKDRAQPAQPKEK